MFNQLTDTVLYPTLFASYVAQILPVGPWGSYALKLTALLLAAGLNVAGIEALSVSAYLLTGASAAFGRRPSAALTAGYDTMPLADDALSVGGTGEPYQVRVNVRFTRTTWHRRR